MCVYVYGGAQIILCTPLLPIFREVQFTYVHPTRSDTIFVSILYSLGIPINFLNVYLSIFLFINKGGASAPFCFTVDISVKMKR